MAMEEATGCGGVLRDEKRIARALFSGPCEARDANSAKIEAIIIGLDVIITMGWKFPGSIIVEDGSRVVYNWLRNK